MAYLNLFYFYKKEEEEEEKMHSNLFHYTTCNLNAGNILPFSYVHLHNIVAQNKLFDTLLHVHSAYTPYRIYYIVHNMLNNNPHRHTLTTISIERQVWYMPEEWIHRHRHSCHILFVENSHHDYVIKWHKCEQGWEND